MNEQFDIDFLKMRMTQLREKNNISLEKLAKEINSNKSSLSRAEKVGSDTSNNKVLEFAERYCDYFNMSKMQTEQFLRGERAVVIDASAMIKRPNILSELCAEYSYVIIPEFVIEDLKNLKAGEMREEITRRAYDLLNKINNDNRLLIRDYSIPNTAEEMIIDIAIAVSSEFFCDVDIITNDSDLALSIRGKEKDSHFHLLFLEKYSVTKQNILNYNAVKIINDYYADSYENIEKDTNIKLPEKNSDEWNCFLKDGSTLIISAVNNSNVPLSQRMEKIRWLMEYGADINMRDTMENNFPPLTHSIQRNDYEMFRFLLYECNADPNQATRNPFDVGKIRHENDGNTPLMVAAWNGHINMVKDLCDHVDISLNQQDSNGFTALIKASYWGFKKCRDIIKSAGADDTIRDHEGLKAEDRWDECMSLGRYLEKREHD